MAMRRIIHVGLSLAVASSSFASAAERVIRFELDNRTGGEIRAVYITPSKSPKWGENLLKSGALTTGKTLSLSFNGECGLYDVRLVAPGGREYMDEEVSFCEENDVLTVGATEIRKGVRGVEEVK
jgi:hypothetical protein